MEYNIAIAEIKKYLEVTRDSYFYRQSLVPLNGLCPTIWISKTDNFQLEPKTSAYCGLTIRDIAGKTQIFFYISRVLAKSKEYFAEKFSKLDTSSANHSHCIINTGWVRVRLLKMRDQIMLLTDHQLVITAEDN